MVEQVRTRITPLQRLLLEHMEATGETFADIARRGGLPRQTVQAVLYRKGPSVPLEATMVKLAKGLGVPVETVHQAVAQGLTDQPANGHTPALRTLQQDPLLLVLMETATQLDAGQRQVLVETARALQRATVTKPRKRASKR